MHLLLPSLKPLLPVMDPSLLQTGHPAFMYVVSELLKVFASEPAADTNMGHILTALLRGACQKLRTLEVSSRTGSRVQGAAGAGAAHRACDYGVSQGPLF